MSSTSTIDESAEKNISTQQDTFRNDIALITKTLDPSVVQLQYPPPLPPPLAGVA